jgi:hypothetical protein
VAAILGQKIAMDYLEDRVETWLKNRGAVLLDRLGRALMQSGRARGAGAFCAMAAASVGTTLFVKDCIKETLELDMIRMDLEELLRQAESAERIYNECKRKLERVQRMACRRTCFEGEIDYGPFPGDPYGPTDWPGGRPLLDNRRRPL